MVRPTTPGQTATIYVCGITPYDATHLGHAATYLAFDLVQRVWLDGGRRVHYVQNITDIDDPLLERADRDGVDWRDLADQRDPAVPRGHDGAAGAAAAGLHRRGRGHGRGHRPPSQALLDMGAAYRVDDAEHPDVYFDVATAPKFGYESRYDLSTMLRAVRRTRRRSGAAGQAATRSTRCCGGWPATASRPGRPRWGRAGRAGTSNARSIAGNRLGPSIDVQGGGSDLIFPHHECSAAHSEVLTGVRAVRPALHARRR